MTTSLGKKTRVGNRTGTTSTTKEVMSVNITTVMTPVNQLRVHVIVTSQVEEGHVIATIQGIEISTTEGTTPLQIAKIGTERANITKVVTAEGKLIHSINILGTQALKTRIKGLSKEEDPIQTKRKKRCESYTPTSRSESWHKLKPSQMLMNMAMNFSGMDSSG